MFVDDVDLGRLEAWLDARGIGTGPLTDCELIGGGSQNVLLAFTRDGHRLVLRRPPRHKRAESDLVLRREARILSALGSTNVPFPRLVAACDDAAVLGGAFHISEFVDGFSLWGEVPEPWASNPQAVHDSGMQVIAAFGALAQVDQEAVGLAHLGKPNWLRRQPERWRRQLASYGESDSVGGERLEGAHDVHDWLVAHMPDREQPGLVHGDAHLGNVLVRSDGTGVIVVDWELCTIGDPRLDLAQLLVTWPGEEGPYSRRVSVPGLPNEEELVECWARVSGRKPEHLHWFRVLAAYRLAVLLEGTHARARAGQAPIQVGDTMHARALGLLASVDPGRVHLRRRGFSTIVESAQV